MSPLTWCALKVFSIPIVLALRFQFLLFFSPASLMKHLLFSCSHIEISFKEILSVVVCSVMFPIPMLPTSQWSAECSGTLPKTSTIRVSSTLSPIPFSSYNLLPYPFSVTLPPFTPWCSSVFSDCSPFILFFRPPLKTFPFSPSLYSPSLCLRLCYFFTSPVLCLVAGIGWLEHRASVLG